MFIFTSPRLLSIFTLLPLTLLTVFPLTFLLLLFLFEFDVLGSTAEDCILAVPVEGFVADFDEGALADVMFVGFAVVFVAAFEPVFFCWPMLSTGKQIPMKKNIKTINQPYF
jgi:hypothetical protein